MVCGLQSGVQLADKHNGALQPAQLEVAILLSVQMIVPPRFGRKLKQRAPRQQGTKLKSEAVVKMRSRVFHNHLEMNC